MTATTAKTRTARTASSGKASARTARATPTRATRTAAKEAAVTTPDVPEYKRTHGVQCTCGAYVMREVDPRDGVERPFDFDIYDESAPEPGFRLWAHRCPDPKGA